MDRPEELEFIQLMLIGISLTFLLSLAVVIFFLYYQRRLFAQQQTMEQMRIAEQRNRLEAEIEARESERSRIALDLHDEVGALLSTVKLYMSYPATAESHTEKEESIRIKAQEMLDDAVHKLRSISRNLSPENLKLFGLISALNEQCIMLEESGAMAIYFNHNLKQRLGLEVETHVYRIIQELLNNTIKHAKATEIRLQLTHTSSRLTIDYSDNGIGFDPQLKATAQSLGLTSLTSRVQILSGEIEINSEPGQGVHIKITIPNTQTQNSAQYE
ncbi:MAG: hypothetical protein CMI36_01675 [Owenweeksia sp.]|nr:hypothetical protein [Owenweeksia sp.]MBF97673.1 hypothetical protein [Owenweeksia sp.]HBF19325.1 hypothetical protein [Cryomorphaceae bacterium]HCQ17367.1 hypothetical protein [Cryomorphaceae bacterium]|tara:strand:- start:134 stop:952 length:819 start_codon:yes stop_codon:yes gene_type:complete